MFHLLVMSKVNFHEMCSLGSRHDINDNYYQIVGLAEDDDDDDDANYDDNDNNNIDDGDNDVDDEYNPAVIIRTTHELQYHKLLSDWLLKELLH